MAYKASLGGIDNSGVRMPNTQPIIDVGSIIDSASKAFANNREGVLHRALLQQAANREDAQHQLRVAEAANNGTMTVDAARRLVDQGGFEDETPDASQPAAAAPTPGAPPPVDASLEGAPGQLIAPTPATGTAPALKPRKSKYTMVDLGNGYATIPELTPGYRQAQMLGTRLDAQGRQIVERGDQTRQTEQAREGNRETLATTKHGFDMEKQAAALASHMAVAKLRASLSTDPSAMKPNQRISLLGKLADTYVSAANGDPDHAVEMAENDPTLSTFGTNAKQLQSFIAGSVGKWQRGELNTNLRTQGQTFESPEQTAARIAKTKEVTAPGAAKQTITAAEAAQLKALGHTDADIAAHYTVK